MYRGRKGFGTKLPTGFSHCKIIKTSLSIRSKLDFKARQFQLRRFNFNQGFAKSSAFKLCRFHFIGQVSYILTYGRGNRQSPTGLFSFIMVSYLGQTLPRRYGQQGSILFRARKYNTKHHPKILVGNWAHSSIFLHMKKWTRSSGPRDSGFESLLRPTVFSLQRKINKHFYVAEFAGKAQWCKPSPMVTLRVHPSPLNCKNEYLVFALSWDEHSQLWAS